jgi:dTMP kinase
VILKHFAVIEGCDGSGTTTQLELLGKRLQALSAPPYFLTCEPTGGPVGQLIRRVLKGDCHVGKETLARLFAADRGEHLYGNGIEAGIAERCRRGELVISDRYSPSSLVYQGLECGIETPKALNAAFPHPELLIYLDVDPDTAMKRIGNREEKQEIYEKADFQARVRAAYLELLPFYEQQGVTLLRLDGTRPPEELSEEIWKAIQKMPIIKEA